MTFNYYDKAGHEITIPTNENWVNYGDLSPIQHGGCFVRWDSPQGRWNVVYTEHSDMFPEDIIPENHVVIHHMYVYDDDVFRNGNPQKGPTEWFLDEIDSLTNVNGYEHALMDFEIEYFVAGIAMNRLSKEYFQPKTIPESEYWDYLGEQYGIESE